MRSDSCIRAAVVFAAALILEVLCRTGVVDSLVMVPPSQMVVALYEVLRLPDIASDIFVTGVNLLSAIIATTIFGFILGLLLHKLARLRCILEPLFISYYAIPTFAFYPLFILMFGVGNTPIITMGILLSLPSMILATWEGLDRFPPVYAKVANSLGMSQFALAAKLKVPATVPFLFTGLRLVIAYSFIGVIAAEFILSGRGVGFAIGFAYNSFDTRQMYGLIFLVVLFVVFLNLIFHTVDRRLELRRLSSDEFH